MENHVSEGLPLIPNPQPPVPVLGLLANKLGLMTMLLVVFLVAGLTNCGAGTTQTTNPGEEGSNAPADAGTDVSILDGNPMDFNTADPDDDDGLNSAPTQTATLDDVLTALCDTADACYGSFSAVACMTQLNTDLNALESFGADTNTYTSFDAVNTAIENSNLSVSSVEFGMCRDAIEALSCADITAAGAFEGSDYSNVYLMIPDEDC